MRHLILSLLFLSLPAVAAEKSINAQSFVRDIGYRVGDVVEQRVEVVTPEGFQLDEGSLPKRRGAGAHIELRELTHETESTAQGVKHILLFDWQVFRALRDVRLIPLRDLELQFRKGDEILVARLHAAEVLMAPMLPTMLTKEQATPRAAIEPHLQPLKPILQQLGWSVIGLLVAVLYFAWRFDWLPFREQHAKPFRHAAREIRSLRTQENGVQASVRVLSRAFNDYAQMAVTQEELKQFFVRHPEMQQFQATIEQFFVASHEMFFAGKADTITQAEVEKLARQLSLMETP
ncbi:hypothetical protein LG198_00425 [Methylobacillus arboreus]|uniref:hypothetical protein n=1 Tax=Methylobacillus arboreus TaxID=755170 RepID=UPI001E539FC7|nr:hypothetical protein [Methylobacillus arboreus]MCB5189198.1 hypothetical protein [Methylobacillus arboreus]